ncbi:MAG: hypothetical protein Q8W44_04715 [Candidatus Palauibacterales bacterium]|nr:hypothetical protein [Candidatus Palauibacterales bacterium]
MEWGEWTPPIPQDDTLLYRPPPRVQLTDNLSGRPVAGSYHAQPAPGSLATPHSVSDWTPVSVDSLWIQWSSGGLHGTLGYFTGRGDTLRGELHTLTDRGGAQRYRTDASLVRISCSTAPAVPASAAGRGLWYVPLEGGDTVHLGRLLPNELIAEAGDVSYRIAGTPTGFFAEAREIRVQLTRGGAVADVRLIYPNDMSFDSLVAAFRDTLGASDPDQPPERARVVTLTSTTSLDMRRSDDGIWVQIGMPGADYGVGPEHVRELRDDTAGADLR